MRLSIPANFKSAVNFGDWTLYHLPLAPVGGSFLWQPFKLMLPPDRAPAKRGETRAYRLVWSPLERRFARDKQVAGLERDQPLLYDLVEFHLSETYGPDWLTGPALYEPAEVEAEQARLKAARTARAAEGRAERRG